MQLKPNDTINVVLHEAKKPESFDPTNLYICAFVAVIIILLLNLNKIRRLWKNIKPSEYKVSIPGFELNGSVKYTTNDQEVAWKLYVELETRVSANKLESDSGILREALGSLHAVFGNLRETLKNGGAELATSQNSTYTITSLLLKIMNEHMRPFLSKWHPMLEEYEKTKAEGVSIFAHEKKWVENAKFREELEQLRVVLAAYIKALRDIAEGK